MGVGEDGAVYVKMMINYENHNENRFQVKT